MYVDVSSCLPNAASTDVQVSDVALRLFWQNAMSLTLQPAESLSERADLYQAFFSTAAPDPAALSTSLASASEVSASEAYATVVPMAEVAPIAEAVVNRTEKHSAEKRVATQAVVSSVPLISETALSKPAEVERPVVSLAQRLKMGLAKTSKQFSLAQLFASKSHNAEVLLAALETQLLMADVGVLATDKLLTAVRRQLAKQPGADVKDLLRQAMLDVLEQRQYDPFAANPLPSPMVVLMVGVNGVGKTTTLGKLAKQLVDRGHSVLLAAGDTFRAAAIEQLQTWGERHNIPVISQQSGADAAAVIFDAISRAKARKIEVVLADTAGRLHNKAHLMDELSKMVRVIKKHDVTAPHAVLLVVDATTGQNAIAQATTFQQLIGATGIVLTKLDGTAKGGIAFALVEQLQLPICYVGVGEQVEDLKAFVARDFVSALLDDETG